MNSKQKKEYIIIGVVAILVIIAIKYFFFNSTPAPVVVNSDTSQNLSGAAGASSSQYLPYGTQLDDKILSDPRFTSLVQQNLPTVSRSDLGTSNPFQ